MREALDEAPVPARFRFFTGKGGVGKTTCAAAAAIAAADAGRRVLLVSTDPAHSLADALGTTLGPDPARVDPGPRRGERRGVLMACELDADRALARWLGPRRAALGEVLARGTWLDDEDIERLLRLSLPGVDELMGLLELERLAASGPHELVCVDTAPTGHTLRLIETPASLGRLAEVLDEMEAKHRYLAQSFGRGAAFDRCEQVIEELADAGRRLAAFVRDGSRCEFTWVVLPEALAALESIQGVESLRALGVNVSDLVVNRLAPRPRAPCASCARRAASEGDALRMLREHVPGPTLRVIPERAREPVGLPELRAVGRRLEVRARPAGLAGPAAGAGRRPRRGGARSTRGDPPWLQALAPPGLRLLLVGGKGGVGKTTCSAALALALARRGEGTRVLLLSTDPAHSLGDVLELEVGDEARRVETERGTLDARELDAARALEVERATYRESIDMLFGLLTGTKDLGSIGTMVGGVDMAFDHAVLRDLIDLAPPGLDELFALLAVVEALGLGGEEGEGPGSRAGSPYDLVVLDTAPTGHTLRLLALPPRALEWVHAFLDILLKYREIVGVMGVGEDLLRLARGLRGLAALLGDGARCRFLPVTRVGELPRLETARLLDALAGLDIAAPGLVVNAVVPAGCPRCDRLARSQGAAVRVAADEVRRRLPGNGAIMLAPAVAPPPRGAPALLRWIQDWRVDPAPGGVPPTP